MTLLTRRVVDVALLLVVSAGAVWYLLQALELIQRSDLAVAISPGIFPFAVSLLFLILAAVSLVKIVASKEPDEKYKVENLPTIAIIALFTVVFVLAWSTWREAFYVLLFALFASVATVLGLGSGRPLVRMVLRNVVVAGVATVSIFLVFDVLFGVNLT